MIEFKTIQDLIDLADQYKKTIGSIVLQWESESSEKPSDILRQKMRQYWMVMEESMTQGLTHDIQSMTGLTGGDARRVNTTSNRIDVGIAALALSLEGIEAETGQRPEVAVAAQPRDTLVVRYLACADAGHRAAVVRPSIFR